MYACLHGPGNLPLLIECARGFSPHIEENPPETVVFDGRGLEALYGPPAALAQEIERRVGVPANVATASNPDAAVHAARGYRGITVIEPGKEAVAGTGKNGVEGGAGKALSGARSCADSGDFEYAQARNLRSPHITATDRYSIKSNVGDSEILASIQPYARDLIVLTSANSSLTYLYRFANAFGRQSISR